MQKRFTVLIFFGVLAFFSCYRSNIGNVGFLYEVEEKFVRELENDPPDFSSPQVEDHECFVENLPEDVIWLTSHPKDLGSPDTQVGGTIHIPIRKYPTTLRTIGQDVDVEDLSILQTNATLVSTNPETNEFMPYAATHWAFGKDGKTVYFKLHEHARWSDGQPVTADDFLFSYELLAPSPESTDSYTFDFTEYFTIEKFSTHCIAIRDLSDGFVLPHILLQSVNISPVPKHFYEQIPDGQWQTDDNQVEPTTGPYEINIRESVEGSILIADRTPDWWARSYEHLKHTANISRIEYIVITENEDTGSSYDDSVRSAFYDGILDMYVYDDVTAYYESFTVPAVDYGYVTQYIMNYIPSTGGYGIFLNTKSKIFSNKNMRMAIFYALDINGLIENSENLYTRIHTVGFGNIWNNIEFNDYTIRKPNFWMREARTIFAACGYTQVERDGILRNSQGERLSFNIVFADKKMTRELTYLKTQAKLCGLEIILTFEPEYYNNIASVNDYDAVFDEIPNSFPPPDHSSFFSLDPTVTEFDINNLCQYSSPEMDELLVQQQTATSIKELAEINKQIERLINEEAIIVPLYVSQVQNVGAWQWVRFPTWGNRREHSIDMTPYGYIWIDDTVKLEVLTAQKNNKRTEPRIYTISSRYLNHADKK